MQCIESEYIVYLHVLAHVAVKCKLYRYILSLLFLLSVPHGDEFKEAPTTERELRGQSCTTIHTRY